MRDRSLSGIGDATSDILTSLARRELVIVVGTGLSISLTANQYPQLSWGGMIKSGLEEAFSQGAILGEQKDRWIAQLASNDIDEVLSAAEFMGRKLGAPGSISYRRWLERSFKNISFQEGALSDSLRKLLASGARFCTLNYDSVLEDVLGVPGILMTERDAVHSWMRQELPGVLHLHGKWSEPETCVLGIRDYTLAIQSESRDLVQRNLASFGRLLFVGCGDTFADPNIASLAKWVSREVRGHNLQHYGLVLENEVSRRRQDASWKDFVEPISYGRQYDDLSSFLAELTAISTHSPAVLPSGPKAQSAKRDALLGKYRDFILRDCGQMTIEGVRADMDTAQRKFDIERLFVPLEVEPCLPDSLVTDQVDEEQMAKWRKENPAIPFGQCLQLNNKIAILALPGAGKSLLLKRLAVAYADPSRRKSSNDMLPDEEMLPVLIRCRDWREFIRSPLIRIIEKMHIVAGQPQLEGLHEALIPELEGGRVLLLIDGLDEIHEARDRETFVNNIDKFIEEYPLIRLVVTSREAGFGLVAPTLARICARLKMCSLNEGSIRLLCDHWHKLMASSSVASDHEADAVANSLLTNFSLRRLAENPLLLTMLLVVKHGAGRLPPDRVSLYERATEVLLDTWNIQGHDPLNNKEAVPQLACLAFEMMRRGVQTVTEKELLEIIEDGRDRVPHIKRYAKGTAYDFLKRVELRSSLLIEGGCTREGISLVPFYQFRHLTFQEYLAAVAVAERHVLDCQDGGDIAAPISGYYSSKEWREVIPMAAVMAKKQADPILIGVMDAANTGRGSDANSIQKAVPHEVSLLIKSIVEEAQVGPATLSKMLDVIAYFANGCRGGDDWISLAKGPFGEELISAAFSIYDRMDWPSGNWIRNTLGSLVAFRGDFDNGFSDSVASLTHDLIRDGGRCDKIKALLSIVGVAWHKADFSYSYISYRSLVDQIEKGSGCGDDDSLELAYISAWAFIRRGYARSTDSEIHAGVEVSTLDAIKSASMLGRNENLRKTACHAIASLRLPRDYWTPVLNDEEISSLLSSGAVGNTRSVASGSLALAYYSKMVDDSDLRERFPGAEMDPVRKWIDKQLVVKRRRKRLKGEAGIYNND